MATKRQTKTKAGIVKVDEALVMVTRTEDENGVTFSLSSPLSDPATQGKAMGFMAELLRQVSKKGLDTRPPIW